jgi:hypothetical protein
MIAQHDLQTIILHHVNVTDMRLENPKTNAKQGDIYTGMRIALLSIHRALHLAPSPEVFASKLATLIDEELEYV